MTHTAMAAFANVEKAQQAVRSLLDAGFTAREVTLVSATDSRTGAGVADDFGASSRLDFDSEEPLYARGAASAWNKTEGQSSAGSNNWLGGFGVPDGKARGYQQVAQKGGAIVLVQADDARRVIAVDILQRFDPLNLRGDVEGKERAQSREGAVVLPVVEETLTVGKREVERGGVCIYTHVVSTPVQEVVVEKQARVVEEVVVKKDVGQLDTQAGYETYEAGFKVHHGKALAQSGVTYEQCTPAYRHGYTVANDPSLARKRWEDIEGDAKTRWDKGGAGPWERFKAAVEHAWETVSGSGDAKKGGSSEHRRV